MKWRRLGEETLLGDVLLTRIGRKPPRWRMEYVRDDGKILAAMLVKSPKGRRGFDVMLDGDGNGYWAPTKGAAIAAFAEAHKTLEAAPISEEGPVL